MISVGRESEHAWNIWATQQFLGKYSVFNSRVVPGPFKDQPRQYQHILEKAKVSWEIAYYYHSFQRNTDENVLNLDQTSINKWIPYSPQMLHAGTFICPYQTILFNSCESFVNHLIFIGLS